MIRNLEEKDMEAVMDIWLTSNIETHDFIPEIYWRKNYEAVRAAIGRAEVCVYEDGGQILGFVGIVEDYIAGIFVKKEFRSAGIGRELLENGKKNHKRLLLDVFAENERALEFYVREGFRIDMERVGDDTGKKEYRMVWLSRRQ